MRTVRWEVLPEIHFCLTSACSFAYTKKQNLSFLNSELNELNNKLSKCPLTERLDIEANAILKKILSLISYHDVRTKKIYLQNVFIKLFTILYLIQSLFIFVFLEEAATSDVTSSPLTGARNVAQPADLTSPAGSHTSATSDPWPSQSDDDIDRLVALHQGRHNSLSSLGVSTSFISSSLVTSHNQKRMFLGSF